ncbi:MAG: O-antigen ligase family protein [Nostocoides sp.]
MVNDIDDAAIDILDGERPVTPHLRPAVAPGRGRHAGRQERIGHLVTGSRGRLVAMVVAVIAICAVAGLAVIPGSPAQVVAWSLAVLTLDVALVFLAVRDFPTFLLALLVVRPLVDGLDAGGGLISLQTFVGALFILAASVWLWRRRVAGRWVRPSVVGFGVGALVLGCAISLLVSIDVGVSAASTVKLGSVWLMVIAIEQVLQDRDQSWGNGVDVRLTRAISLSAVPVLVWCVADVINGSSFVDPQSLQWRATGPFVHPNVLGAYLLVVIVVNVSVALQRGYPGRLWHGLLLVPLVVALGFTYARFAWGLTLVAVLFLLWRFARWLIGPVVLALVVAVLSAPRLADRVTGLWATPGPAPGVPANSMAWRVGYWQYLLELANLRPLNGYGYGTAVLVGGVDLEAHNVWVQSYLEIGLFGTLTLLAMVASIAVVLRRRRCGVSVIPHATAMALAVALLVSTMTENVLSETTILWYAVIVLAMGYIPAMAQRGVRSDPPDVGQGAGASVAP